MVKMLPVIFVVWRNDIISVRIWPGLLVKTTMY